MAAGIITEQGVTGMVGLDQPVNMRPCWETIWLENWILTKLQVFNRRIKASYLRPSRAPPNNSSLRKKAMRTSAFCNSTERSRLLRRSSLSPANPIPQTRSPGKIRMDLSPRLRRLHPTRDLHQGLRQGLQAAASWPRTERKLARA